MAGVLFLRRSEPPVAGFVCCAHVGTGSAARAKSRRVAAVTRGFDADMALTGSDA